MLHLFRRITLIALIGLGVEGCADAPISVDLKNHLQGETVQPDWYSRLESAVTATNIWEVSQVLGGASRLQVQEVGYPLLQTAIDNRSCEIVGMLIRAGADANYGPESERTPLMLACCLGEERIVALLLKSGAKVNETRRGSTALHFAALGPDAYLFRKRQILSDLAMNPSPDNYRRIVELEQEEAAYISTVELLLKSGAQPNMRNEIGQTPRDVARPTGQERIERLLSKY